jgi:hypothetical protein
MPDKFKRRFGDLVNMAMFTIPGDRTAHVYRKNGAKIEQAPLSIHCLGKFEETTLTLNPETEVTIWPAQETGPLH